MRTFRKIVLWILPVAVLVIVVYSFPFSRYTALGLLRGESFQDDRSVSHWAYLLRHTDDANGRKLAAFNLGQMGEDSHSAEGALVEALRTDESDDVRFNAALALSKVRPESRETIDALGAALDDDPHPQVRLNCAMALANIGPAARSTVPQLITALKRPDNRPMLGHLMMSVRQQVIRALGLIGPSARDAVPALTELVDDRAPPIRAIVVIALGRIGPDARPAVPKLQALVDVEDDPDIRRAAIHAIALIEHPEKAE